MLISLFSTECPCIFIFWNTSCILICLLLPKLSLIPCNRVKFEYKFWCCRKIVVLPFQFSNNFNNSGFFLGSEMHMSWRNNVSSWVFVCGCVFLLFCFLAPSISYFGSVMQHLDILCYLKLCSVSVSGCPVFVAVLCLADPSLTLLWSCILVKMAWKCFPYNTVTEASIFYHFYLTSMF